MASEQESISGQPQSTISIEYSHAVYKDGDILEGFVVIHNTKVIYIKSIVVHCKGQAKFDSNRGINENTYVNAFGISNSETYFDLMVNVLISTDLHRGERIRDGNHRYSFQFQLPEKIPSTFVAPLGSVEYSCNVIVQLHVSGNQQLTNNNVQHERPFVVESRVDINVLPNAMESLGLIDRKKFRSFLCIPAGYIQVTVLLDQMAYVVGDKIKMNIWVDNRYRQLQFMAINLRRIIVYITKKKKVFSQIQPPLTTVSFYSQMPPGRRSDNNVVIAIPVDIPPSDAEQCKIMKTGYFVEVALWIDPLSEKPPIFHVELPIFIGNENQSHRGTAGTGTSTTTTALNAQTGTSTTTTPGTVLADLPPSYETLNFPGAK